MKAVMLSFLWGEGRAMIAYDTLIAGRSGGVGVVRSMDTDEEPEGDTGTKVLGWVVYWGVMGYFYDEMWGH